MKRAILCAVALAASLMAALAVETGCPVTPLGWPFTAVVKDLKLYDSASIDGKVTGTVPVDVELSYRESEESEHWIYIDDNDRRVHGWCLDWGGFYGDESNRDPDVSAYQNSLDYAYVTLGHNPKAYQREDGAVCDYDEEADEAVADAGSPVDAGYDDALDKAVASKASGRKSYTSESGWDKFMKWVIIILVGIGVLTAWFPVLPQPFKNNSHWYLAAAGVAEIIYSLHWSVYASYGSNQLFSMFILGLVQILGLLARHRSPAARWCRWVSVAGMATALVTAIAVNGIGTILASIAGGILNIVVGCVVVTLIYAFFKDGFDGSGGRSSGRGSGEDTPKRDGTFDGCCDNCSLWNSSTRRCGRYGNITSPNDHCNGHVWG